MGCVFECGPAGEGRRGEVERGKGGEGRERVEGERVG